MLCPTYPQPLDWATAEVRQLTSTGPRWVTCYGTPTPAGNVPMRPVEEVRKPKPVPRYQPGTPLRPETPRPTVGVVYHAGLGGRKRAYFGPTRPTDGETYGVAQVARRPMPEDVEDVYVMLAATVEAAQALAARCRPFGYVTRSRCAVMVAVPVTATKNPRLALLAAGFACIPQSVIDNQTQKEHAQ